MTIDPLVARTARHFGLDAKLIQAVVTAEGNIVRAVRISVPSVTTVEEALEITCRSAVHAMSDYLLWEPTAAELAAGDAEKTPAGFVRYWARRWAPRHADNDPTDLNKNWPVNVIRLWLGETT